MVSPWVYRNDMCEHTLDMVVSIVSPIDNGCAQSITIFSRGKAEWRKEERALRLALAVEQTVWVKPRIASSIATIKRDRCGLKIGGFATPARSLPRRTFLAGNPKNKCHSGRLPKSLFSKENMPLSSPSRHRLGASSLSKQLTNHAGLFEMALKYLLVSGNT